MPNVFDQINARMYRAGGSVGIDPKGEIRLDPASGQGLIIFSTSATVTVSDASPKLDLEVTDPTAARFPGVFCTAFQGSFTGHALVIGRVAGGTKAAPAAAASHSTIMAVKGEVWNGSAGVESTRLAFTTVGPQVNSSTPSRITLTTTPVSSTVAQVRLMIGPSGSVGVGVFASYVSLADTLHVAGSAVVSGSISVVGSAFVSGALRVGGEVSLASGLTLGTSLHLPSFATSSLALSGIVSVPTSCAGYLSVVISGVSRNIPFF